MESRSQLPRALVESRSQLPCARVESRYQLPHSKEKKRRKMEEVEEKEGWGNVSHKIPFLVFISCCGFVSAGWALSCPFWNCGGFGFDAWFPHLCKYPWGSVLFDYYEEFKYQISWAWYAIWSIFWRNFSISLLFIGLFAFYTISGDFLSVICLNIHVCISTIPRSHWRRRGHMSSRFGKSSSWCYFPCFKSLGLLFWVTLRDVLT